MQGRAGKTSQGMREPHLRSPDLHHQRASRCPQSSCPARPGRGCWPAPPAPGPQGPLQEGRGSEQPASWKRLATLRGGLAVQAQTVPAAADAAEQAWPGPCTSLLAPGLGFSGRWTRSGDPGITGCRMPPLLLSFCLPRLQPGGPHALWGGPPGGSMLFQPLHTLLGPSGMPQESPVPVAASPASQGISGRLPLYPSLSLHQTGPAGALQGLGSWRPSVSTRTCALEQGPRPSGYSAQLVSRCYH